MRVPRVDADGNELGGVPTVLRDAPLGTYLGWNITASGFHAAQVCNYVGGMVPFARTREERTAKGDPRRLSARDKDDRERNQDRRGRERASQRRRDQ